MKTIYLGTSVLDRQPIKDLVQLGFFVFGTDINPNSLGKDAPSRFINIDSTDSHALRKRLFQLSAIDCSTFVYPSSERFIASSFDLNALINPEFIRHRNSYLIFQDKSLQKRLFKDLHIPSPNSFEVINIISSLDQSMSFPLIAKPMDGWASRGVSLINDQRELTSYLREYNPSNFKPILLEEYCGDGELTVGGVLKSGQYIPLFDYETIPHLPSFQVGHLIVSNNSTSFVELAHQYLSQILVHLGLENIPISANYIIKDSPLLLEITPTISLSFANLCINHLHYSPITLLHSIVFDIEYPEPCWQNQFVGLKQLFPDSEHSNILSNQKIDHVSQYSLTNKDILRLSSPDLTANNLLDTTKPVGLVFAQANTRQELITKLDAIAISFWQQFYQT